MKVLVGLGNPGRRYVHTRHNIGFRVIDHFAKEESIRFSKSETLGAVWGKGLHGEEEVRVVLPQRFMNRSGEVVRRLVSKWHFPLEQMLVVVDDLALPLGQLRIRPHGSDGGQKGLFSIIEALGTEDFPRLRVGIGSGVADENWETYVLKPFARKEASLVASSVKKASEGCRLWIEEEMDVCMNRLNKREKT